MTPNPIGRARESIREAAYAYPQSTLDARNDALTVLGYCESFKWYALPRGLRALHKRALRAYFATFEEAE